MDEKRNSDNWESSSNVSFPSQCHSSGEKNEKTRIKKPLQANIKSLSTCQGSCTNTMLCNQCRRCILKHCICGEIFAKDNKPWNLSLCLESRACNCITRSRCEICKGCRRQFGSHCRCLYHQIRMKTLFKMKEFQEQEYNSFSFDCLDSFHNTLDNIKLNIRKEDTSSDRVSIFGCACIPSFIEYNLLKKKYQKMAELFQKQCFPSSQSIYDNKISKQYNQPSITIPGVYNGLKYKLHNFESYQIQDSLSLGDKALSYMDGILERGALAEEYMKPTINIRNRIADRAVENSLQMEEYNKLMPMEGMMDYIIYLASIKISSMPELIGTFESSSLVAVGIIVEEYLRQLVNDFIHQDGTLTIPTMENLSIYIYDILDGISIDSITEVETIASDISMEMCRVFGNEAIKFSEPIKKIVEMHFEKAGVVSFKRKRRTLKSFAKIKKQKKDKNTNPNSLVHSTPWNGIRVMPYDNYGRPTYIAHYENYNRANTSSTIRYGSQLPNAETAFDLLTTFQNYRAGKVKTKKTINSTFKK